MNLGALGRLRWPGFQYEFASPLGGAAWAVLLGIPVGIIALYFLKLRRRPVQVPSTLLWRRSIEDLHVNSLFQRLRRNLLLFLQLLMLALAMLALTGPRLRGTSTQGRRLVLAIDESASMSATDVRPSRLAQAKAKALELVDGMTADDLAMVIAFSDRARVVSSYTSDRRALRKRIEAIAPGQGTTSLRDALQVAAGLANPSKQIGEGVVATSVVMPRLYIYTDGGFPDVEGFSLGNLEPEIVVIGPPPPPVTDLVSPADPGSSSPRRSNPPSDNLAVLALQTRRDDEKPDLYQVFGRVHNFRAEAVETRAQLLRHDPENPSVEPTLIDAIALSVPATGEQSFKFDLPAAGPTELEVRLEVADALPLDNRAFTLIGAPRKAQVLLVTPGNRYLVDTLRTPVAAERADVVVVTPEQARTDPFARDARAGRYDLVIYDRFRPETNPEANTLYFGALPPGPAYEKPKSLERPVVLDWNVSHPLLQYVRDLGTVAILKATTVDPPTGSSILIESNLGALAFAAPREGYTDAVVTFPLLDGENFNTTWFKNISFPLFLFNALQVLGNAREAIGDETHQPGRNIVLRLETTEDPVRIIGPDGRAVESVARSPQGTYVVSQANRTGTYHARWSGGGAFPFVVNLFDPRESDLAPRGLVPAGVPEEKADAYKIKIGYNPVAGTRTVRPTKVDWWKPLAAAALAVLVLEWYIYNRRVYI